jgi:hypothetical protein
MPAAASAAASVARAPRSAADPTRPRLWAQHALATTVVYALAPTLAAVALVFALLAAHAGLRLVVPAWAAALSISGACVGLALGAWLVARRRAGTRLPEPIELPPITHPAITKTAATLAAAAALVPLLDATLAAARARPGETMLTALAAGVVAGCLRPGPAR